MTPTAPDVAKAREPLDPVRSPDWYTEFVPRRGLRNPHLQTIVGNFLRRDWHLPAPGHLLTPVDDPDAVAAGYAPTQLLSLCHWQPAAVRRERLTVLLLHGLEGSASSGYVLGNASRAWAAGCNVVRLNMRSCGGSDALAPTIYHSGRCRDVAAVVDAVVGAHDLERVAVVGYSMGANLVLNYAAGQSEGPSQVQRIQQLKAVVGVSPLMDLAASSAALHDLQNRVYERRFLKAMKRRLRAKALLFPRLYASLQEEGVYSRMHSLRDFDQEIVARYGGFLDANDYYASVASSRHAASLATPTLILYSRDDPFIRLLPATRQALAANPHVTYVETAHGGHCAFLASSMAQATTQATPHVMRARDPHWAEHTLLAWLRVQVPEPEAWAPREAGLP